MKRLLALILLSCSFATAQDWQKGKVVSWTTFVNRYHSGKGSADEFGRVYHIRAGTLIYEVGTDNKIFAVGDAVQFRVRGDDIELLRKDGSSKKYRIWGVADTVESCRE